MQIVYLQEARQHVFTGRKGQEMILTPGRNMVEDALYNAVANAERGDNSFTRMIENGKVSVAGGEIDVSKRTAKEAITFIEAEVDVDNVRQFLEQENNSAKPRRSVVQAAQDKITAIVEAEATTGRIKDAADVNES